MNKILKCENLKQATERGLPCKNAIDEGCRGQGESPSQSAAGSNAGVAPVSTSKVDGGSGPVIVRRRPSFL